MAEESPDQPPAKRTKYDFSESFDILVGAERKKFSVHYHFIADRSAVLQGARSSQWHRKFVVATALSKTDPEDFSNYLQLAYFDTIAQPDPKIPRYSTNCSAAEGEDDIRLASESYFFMLARLYVLADKLQDLLSANKVMDRLLSFNSTTKFLLPRHTITWVWEHSPANSTLRKMVRDIYIYETPEGYFDERGEAELPYELLIEIVREQRRLTKVNAGKQISEVYRNRILEKFYTCDYHQHKDGEPRCK